MSRALDTKIKSDLCKTDLGFLPTSVERFLAQHNIPQDQLPFRLPIFRPQVVERMIRYVRPGNWAYAICHDNLDTPLNIWRVTIDPKGQIVVVCTNTDEEEVVLSAHAQNAQLLFDATPLDEGHLTLSNTLILQDGVNCSTGLGYKSIGVPLQRVNVGRYVEQPQVDQIFNLYDAVYSVSGVTGPLSTSLIN